MLKTEDIEELLEEVRRIYGPHSIIPYGDWDDPQSVGFRVQGIPASFSVIVTERMPERHYNIQVEYYPPQTLDYLYHKPAISLWDFMELLKRISGHRDDWPK